MIDTLFSSKDSTMCVVVDAIMRMTMLMVMSSMMWGGGIKVRSLEGKKHHCDRVAAKHCGYKMTTKGGNLTRFTGG